MAGTLRVEESALVLQPRRPLRPRHSNLDLAIAHASLEAGLRMRCRPVDDMAIVQSET